MEKENAEQRQKDHADEPTVADISRQIEELKALLVQQTELKVIKKGA